MVLVSGPALHPFYSRRVFLQTPPPISKHHRSRPEDVAAMRGDLTLKRALVSANLIAHSGLHDLRSLCVKPLQMAGEARGKNQVDLNPTKESQPKKEEEEASKKLPPPPEKPLPGDCCGNGCVRCVWDVYYEEVEEYNKLLKNDSNSR